MFLVHIDEFVGTYTTYRGSLMSYVDAYFDSERDRIHVVERVDGKRESKE